MWCTVLLIQFILCLLQQSIATTKKILCRLQFLPWVLPWINECYWRYWRLIHWLWYLKITAIFENFNVHRYMYITDTHCYYICTCIHMCIANYAYIYIYKLCIDTSNTLIMIYIYYYFARYFIICTYAYKIYTIFSYVSITYLLLSLHTYISTVWHDTNLFNPIF